MTAVDLSNAMIDVARRRLAAAGLAGVEFLHDDALRRLQIARDCDVVFTSWVLGYIPLRPFFSAAATALAPGGRLALVVHRENSPRAEYEIFGELVARDPSALTKQVAFDFPADAGRVGRELARVGLRPARLWEGRVVFRYAGAEEVLEHLLKSGAGTVFYEAIAPERRDELTAEFLRILRDRNGPGREFSVMHEYVGCVAEKPGK